MNYQEFIAKKIKTNNLSGFEVDQQSLNPILFDFQKYIILTALRKGKFAIFSECGTGKTFMQLEWANQVVKHTGGNVLILCPLAVSQQTIEEGQKLGIEVGRYPSTAKINITNYEQIENISDQPTGIVLDESSILKNFTGATKKKLMEHFTNTPYKLCCTATPSPNDDMEICNHAEFLNQGRREEILAMYFTHDGGETAKWRLKGHAQKIFWNFVKQWSIMVSNPSDIGFDGSKYILPKLNLIERVVSVPVRDLKLFNDISVNVTNFNAELRITLIDRMDEVVSIVNNSEDNFIVWIKQNVEGEYLMERLNGAKEVRGSQEIEHKEKTLLGFAHGDFRVLVTKTKIACFGLNYQNCHNQIFASLDFSFEQLYQAIRRSYRFGQTHSVNIYIITTDTMRNVIASIKQKQEQFENMKYHLNIKLIMQENYKLINGDSCQEIQNIESESIHFSIFSPPFAELYVYSNDHRDMGNCKNYNEFFEHFNFLTPELYRVLIPGRLVAVHCMDLPIQKGKEGYIGLRDFSGMLINNFQQHGFIYHSRITIWKDPVTEMQRTKAIGLLNKQKDKDATLSRVGIPDYLLIFRKEGENPIPVEHSSTDAKDPNYIPISLWQKYASPVWMDIDYGKTLNKEGRESEDEKHIAPLQLETIERAIHLWTNPGETVFTPFLGIGSEIFQALKMGRRGVGIELKESYFKIAQKNCANALLSKSQLSFV